MLNIFSCLLVVESLVLPGSADLMTLGRDSSGPCVSNSLFLVDNVTLGKNASATLPRMIVCWGLASRLVGGMPKALNHGLISSLWILWCVVTASCYARVIVFSLVQSDLTGTLNNCMSGVIASFPKCQLSRQNSWVLESSSNYFPWRKTLPFFRRKWRGGLWSSASPGWLTI